MASVAGGKGLVKDLELAQLAGNNALRALYWSERDPSSQLYVELAVISAMDAWHFGKVALGYGTGPVSNKREG